MSRLWHSITAKLVAIGVVFVAVPIIVFGQFKAADDDRRALLSRLVEEQGLLVAAAVTPLVEGFDGQSVQALNDTLSLFHIDDLRVKLLFRPKDKPGSDNFFYIAAAPRVPTSYLSEERAGLVGTGVLERLRDTCDENKPLAIRFTNPAGETEVLTSITPIDAPSGCWAVITSRSTAGLLGSAMGGPYWTSRQVQVSALIYAMMAVLMAALFWGIRHSLRQFVRTAREIRDGVDGVGTFASRNRVPELGVVAADFDRLVSALRGSAKAVREAAEENAHALKTPIGTIRQLLEPLRRSIARDDARGRRALEILEASTDRLDTLVTAARRLAEDKVGLIVPVDDRIDLSSLVARIAEDYETVARQRGRRLSSEIDERVYVPGSVELLEPAVENVLENALDFSPPQGEVTVAVRKANGRAELLIADEGPGIPSHLLEKAFERYASFRPTNARAAEDLPSDDRPHFGIGLFVVRRNIEALGGSVRAENRRGRGLEVRIALPLAAARS